MTIHTGFPLWVDWRSLLVNYRSSLRIQILLAYWWSSVIFHTFLPLVAPATSRNLDLFSFLKFGILDYLPLGTFFLERRLNKVNSRKIVANHNIENTCTNWRTIIIKLILLMWLKNWRVTIISTLRKRIEVRIYCIHGCFFFPSSSLYRHTPHKTLTDANLLFLTFRLGDQLEHPH